MSQPVFRLTRVLSLFIALLLSSVVNSAEMDAIDLKVTMKQMRLAYTQALKTTSAEQFNLHMDEINQLLTRAQRYPFSSDRATISQQGLSKVAAVLQGIQQQTITSANLDTAQAKLKQVDQLRKEYHRKSKPSIWQTIFG